MERGLHEAFEAEFRAEGFRLIYPVHCGIFASLVAVLAFGLSDPTFNLISKVLMVPAVAETVLRIALHHHPRFRADTKLAQIVGSRAMLVMTTASWLAYYFIAGLLRDRPAAGPLISAAVPMMMVVYPVEFELFFPSVAERTFATATSFVAVAAAPRWSALRDRPAFEGEAAVHCAAIFLGVLIAQPIEGTLRSFARKYMEVGQKHEASFHGGQHNDTAATGSIIGGIEAEIEKLASDHQRREASKGSNASPVEKTGEESPIETGMPSVFESLSQAAEYEQNWEQLRVLGSGSFGKAVLFRHRSRVDFAVIKQTWSGRGGGGADLRRLEREVSALMSLKNQQHVIRYRTCFLQNEMLCIVTDYAAGGTLHHQIVAARKSAKHLPVAALLRWAAQLASALHAIHSEKVMHRDVKPSNILLTEKLDIKLGDFGLSRPHNSIDLATTACGTPYYMSPELINAERYSYPADVWAFGCVLFELLTLNRAFNADSFPQLAKAILGSDSDASTQNQSTLLAQCKARDPSLPDALLALPTANALLHRSPVERMALADVADVLWPLLPPGERPPMSSHSSSEQGSFKKRRSAQNGEATDDDNAGNTLRRRRAPGSTVAAPTVPVFDQVCPSSTSSDSKPASVNGASTCAACGKSGACCCSSHGSSSSTPSDPGYQAMDESLGGSAVD